jgi:hypothetical protein
MLTRDRLTIYLQDHLAGATGGLDLARRLTAENEGTEYGPPLKQLAQQIAEDRQELEDMMTRLGVRPDRIKNSAAWALEKVGRLKPNGSLLAYSPLSRVVELEALSTGVLGKLRGWNGLRVIAPRRSELDPERLDRLIGRAESQLDTLAELHRKAADEAL